MKNIKTKPILFSAPMVLALLEGRKTQTRRIIKTQPTGRVDPLVSYNHGRMEVAFGPDMRDARGGPKWWRPLAQGGDRLWVREALQADRMGNILTGERDTNAIVAYYAADDAEVLERNGFNISWEWKRPTIPSIHMPRWASRITLEVTGVRVERLQDISREDAIAEGIEQSMPDVDPWLWKDYGSELDFDDPVLSYASLWDSINGTGAWDANPWVAAYTFRVHLKNIDQMGGGNG